MEAASHAFRSSGNPNRKRTSQSLTAEACVRASSERRRTAARTSSSKNTPPRQRGSAWSAKRAPSTNSPARLELRRIGGPRALESHDAESRAPKAVKVHARRRDAFRRDVHPEGGGGGPRGAGGAPPPPAQHSGRA